MVKKIALQPYDFGFSPTAQHLEQMSLSIAPDRAMLVSEFGGQKQRGSQLSVCMCACGGGGAYLNRCNIK